MDEIRHYGVKGMKWGVRKARTAQLGKRAARNERVAEGKGSLLDKTITLGGSSTARLVTSGGLRNEAARRATNKRSEIKRLADGKAKVTDILKAYGTVSTTDLARAANKKTDFEVN